MKHVFFCAMAALVLLVVYRICQIPFCPMQEHKFPPDFVFLTYGVMVLAALSMLFSRVTLPNWHILRLWNEQGFNIYLFQNIPYTAVAIAIRHTVFTSSTWVQIILSVIVIFCFSTVTFSVWRHCKEKR